MKILVVDDDRVLADLIAFALRREVEAYMVNLFYFFDSGQNENVCIYFCAAAAILGGQRKEHSA
ncbi:MAG: hypothetical protein OHK0052_18410 [Anaerolineales bacterium]